MEYIGRAKNATGLNGKPQPPGNPGSDHGLARGLKFWSVTRGGDPC